MKIVKSVLLAVLLTAPVFASAAPLKVGMCLNCHENDKTGAPSLKGLSSKDIFAKLENFKSGKTPGKVMPNTVKPHSSEELVAIAGEVEAAISKK